MSGRADLVAGITQDHRPHQVRPFGRHPLRDHAPDRQTADDDILGFEMLDQRNQVIDVIIHGDFGVAQFRETMATLVIGDDAVVSNHPDDHVAPDPVVRAKRIGEDDRGFVRGRADHLMMDDDTVQAGKLHGEASFRDDLSDWMPDLRDRRPARKQNAVQ
jgi:hypothetical protein